MHVCVYVYVYVCSMFILGMYVFLYYVLNVGLCIVDVCASSLFEKNENML